MGRELSYRLGQSLSAIVRAVVDGSNSIDASVAKTIAGGTGLSLVNIRTAVQSLGGRAVQPFNEQEQLMAGVNKIAPVKFCYIGGTLESLAA